MIIFFRISIVGALMLLVACTGSPHNDLDTYVKDTLAAPVGEIEPVPTFRPYKAYRYSVAGLRSPFEPPQAVISADNVHGRVAVAPDEARDKDPLEAYGFSSLTMVGIIEKSSVLWALIDDGHGLVHPVKIGAYMGKNHGKIKAMTRSQVDVVEIVPDGKSGWLERPRTLALKENQSE